MEMKETIIDGVDVAECEHYCEKLNTGSGIIQNASKQGFCLHNITGLQEADIYFRMLSFPKCREQSNCHYKQLKRLEQENAELKEKIIKLSEEKGHLIVKNNTLEEANQSLSVLGTDLASANEIVRKEFFRADKNKDAWREKAENLQKTLQEIKEILLQAMDVKSNAYNHFLKVEQAIDLITKAEVGE